MNWISYVHIDIVTSLNVLLLRKEYYTKNYKYVMIDRRRCARVRYLTLNLSVI